MNDKLFKIHEVVILCDHGKTSLQQIAGMKNNYVYLFNDDQFHFTSGKMKQNQKKYIKHIEPQDLHLLGYELEKKSIIEYIKNYDYNNCSLENLKLVFDKLVEISSK